MVREEQGSNGPQDADRSFSVRPGWVAAGEVSALCLMFLFLSYAVLAGPDQGTFDWNIIIPRAVEYGESLSAHVGWLFGIQVSVLLAFYILLVGNQLSGPNIESEMQLRRGLGLAGQFMGASMLPSMFLICIYCIHRPEEAGILFAVAPSSVIIFTLGVKLGGFIVLMNFEKKKQLEARAGKLARVLERTSPCSSRGTLRSLLLSAAVPMVISIAACVVLAKFFEYQINPLPIVLWSIGGSLCQGVAFIYLRTVQLTSFTRADWLMFLILTLCAFLTFVSAGFNVLAFRQLPPAVIIFTQALVYLISSYWRLGKNWRTLGGFTVNSSSARIARWWASRNLIKTNERFLALLPR